MASIGDVLLQRRAFEALSLKTFRHLYEFDKLKYLAPEYNHIEFTEIYKYTDLNTVLKFAVLNNLINIARRAARDGGQFVLTSRAEFNKPISREMAEFILERHNNPRLHLSNIAMRDEIDLLKYNAILNNDVWLMRRMGVDFDAPNANVLSYRSDNILLALLASGNVRVLRQLLANYRGVHGSLMHHIYNIEVGMSGKREMYEFVCELVLGPGIRVAIPANHQDQTADNASIINSVFVYGALYNGHYDIAREIMDNEEIQFRFHERMETPDIFGSSKHCVYILQNMAEELADKGMEFDYDNMLEYAAANRRLDVIQYIEETQPETEFTDVILINAIESSSTEMVQYILERYDIPDDEELDQHFGDVVSSNSIEMIMMFMRMGVALDTVLDMNMFEEHVIGFLRNALENTTTFIFSNIVGAGQDQDALHRCLIHILYGTTTHTINNLAELFYSIVFAPNVQDVNWAIIINKYIRNGHGPHRAEYEFFINVMHITPDDMETLVVRLGTALRNANRPDDFAVAARYAANENMDKFNHLMRLAE